MIVLTPKGVWSGGKRQAILDLKSGKIGLVGIREDGWEYPAYHYFDRLARKLGDGISENLEKLEKEVEEGKLLAFLGEPEKAVAINARELLRDQKKTREERLEEKVLEVLAKRGSVIANIGENEVKEGLRVICKTDEDREMTDFYFLMKRRLLEEDRFRSLLRFLTKAAQVSGKWMSELSGGGEKDRKKVAWTREPGYRIDLFLGDEGHYHKNLISYRLEGFEERLAGFDPGIYLVLTLFKTPLSATEFYPHLLNLSLGGEPTHDPDKEEVRKELGDISQELSRLGKGEMELVKADQPSRGRIAVFTRPLYNEVRIGYLEFEAKDEDLEGGDNGEEKKMWVVSEKLGTGKQSLVEEEKMILIPKGVEIQSYSLLGLLGSLSLYDLDVSDVEDITRPGETSSYFSKEVGKVLWGLKKRLNVSWAKVTCVVAPFALEGEDENGYHFYFRERGGCASISLVTRPGVSFSLALDRSIPLVRVEHEETFVVGSNPEETVEVIAKLYERAKKILKEMYT